MKEIVTSFAVSLGLIVALSVGREAQAQSVTEESIESRFQLDFHVPEEALKKFLPAGWDVQMAATGPAKDCNLRVIFIDRVNVNGPDGKTLGTGASQMVYLTVPVKNSASGSTVQMVIAGLTGDSADVPGPFGVYTQAAGHQMKRSTVAGKGIGIIEEQTWEFTAAGGERIESFVKYERVPAARARRETTYVSAADPKITQVSKVDMGLNIARNATVEMPDRVKEFRYKIGGGRLAPLFDGTERVVSVDIFPWNNLTIAAAPK